MLNLVDNGRIIELSFYAPAYHPNAIPLEHYKNQSNYSLYEFIKELQKYHIALGICPVLEGGFIIQSKYNETHSFTDWNWCDLSEVFNRTLTLVPGSFSSNDKMLKVYFKLLKPFYYTPNIPKPSKPSKKRKRTNIPKGIRHEVFKRDGYRCVECGAKKGDKKPDGSKVVIHCDHILPLAKGGTDEMSNLQTLCQDCNLNKNDVYQKVKDVK